MRKTMVVALILAFVALLPAVVFGQGKTFLLSDVGKAKASPWFKYVYEGMQEAAKEHGDTVYNNGPVEITAEGQIEVLNSAILQGTSAIMVSANDVDAVVPVLKKAQAKKILTVGFDSVPSAGVDFSVNIVDLRAAGAQMVEIIGSLIGYQGKIAIVSSAPNMSVQNAMNDGSKEALKKNPKYAKMQLVATVYTDDQVEKSYTETAGLLTAYPDLRGILSPSAVPTGPICKVIDEKGLKNKVEVTGMGIPSLVAQYMDKGILKRFVLVGPSDVGYVTLLATRAILSGELPLKAGAVLKTKRMGNYPVEINASGVPQITMKELMEFNKSNIAEWRERL